jgi:hypothetical protein
MRRGFVLGVVVALGCGALSCGAAQGSTVRTETTDFRGPVFTANALAAGFLAAPKVTIEQRVGDGWVHEPGSGRWLYSGPPIDGLIDRVRGRVMTTADYDGARQTLYEIDPDRAAALVASAPRGRPPMDVRDAVMYVATRGGRMSVTVVFGLDAEARRAIDSLMTTPSSTDLNDRLLTALRIPGEGGCPALCGRTAERVYRDDDDRARTEWTTGAATIAIEGHDEPCGPLRRNGPTRTIEVAGRSVELADLVLTPRGELVDATGFAGAPSTAASAPGARLATATCVDQPGGASVDVWVVGSRLDDRDLARFLASLRPLRGEERARTLDSARLVSGAIEADASSPVVSIPLPIPDPLPTGRPGELISQRRLPTPGIPDRRLYAVAYHSTDANGADVAATGTVSVPTDLRQGAPVVVIGHGSRPQGDGCSGTGTPSAADPSPMQVDVPGAGDPDLHPYPADAVVVTPDYLGHGGSPGPHLYFDPDTLAHALLDAARVARAFGGVGPVALQGFSEGAAAVLDAGARWKTYAPELDLRGVVATGVPSHLTDVYRDANISFGGVGYLNEIIFGVIAAHPELDPSEILTPSGLQWLEARFKAERSPFCDQPRALQRDTDLRVDPATIPAWKAALDATNSDRLPIAVPTLLVSEAGDTITPPYLADDVCRNLTANGTDVRMWRYAGGQHGGLRTQADQRQWITDRLDGKPVSDSVWWRGPVPIVVSA